MKKIYFVGNAHLDPVWMWRWQEGTAEAKATIRSALDRMKEYPEFRFVCSSSIVYQWIEAFDPAMFEEIRERVREGRFVIVGGWIVQPDCNLPSGESFARHSLYGQRYFKEKFGVTSKIGYNVDSFGHHLMLPQILKKSGMDCYVFMRPNKTEKTLPSELFTWQSPDGSAVTAWRILGPYTANLQGLSDLETRIAANEAESRNPTDRMLFFYGVGNHGGGPTKQNINSVLEYRKAHPEREVIFSDLSDFFEEVRPWQNRLPVHTDDLQHHASGCYAAVSFIKNAVRRTENAMYAAEVFAFMAKTVLRRGYDVKAFKNAWENLLFCQFHDILGGCSVKDAYSDAADLLGESKSFAAKTENTALQSLSWAIDTSDAQKGYPIVVFNPHGFDVEELITVNAQVPEITDAEGNALPIQEVRSQTFSCKARSDTAFLAKVPAMGYATYYRKEAGGAPAATEDCSLRIDANSMENERLRVEFEAHTGYIRSVYDKARNMELSDGFCAVPVVIDEFEHDTWSHRLNFFDREIARFSDGELKIIEHGPLRVTMKVVNRYNDSVLTQYFSLRRGSGTLDVRATVDWHEKHKLLKLAYSTAYREVDAYYEIPFGVIRRPTDGEEEPGLRWFALRKGNDGLAMLNNNKYSFSVKDNVMNLTVVRSPLYGDHGRGRDDECEFTDQGAHEFAYALMPIGGNGWSEVIREAEKRNLPMSYIMENNHNGTLPTCYRGFSCDRENVAVSALKMSEDGTGAVLRLYETDGVETRATVSGALLPKPLCAHLGAYSVNTYFCSYETGEWKEVLLTEYDA